MRLIFKAWRRFHALRDYRATDAFLEDAGHAAVRAFKNMGTYPPASTPAEYPAIRTGRLRSSIGFETAQDELTVGSGEAGSFYAQYLRTGTTRMARRKMSDNALQEGVEAARGRLRSWVRWRHG